VKNQQVIETTTEREALLALKLLGAHL